jgi:hypothetical protein
MLELVLGVAVSCAVLGLGAFVEQVTRPSPSAASHRDSPARPRALPGLLAAPWSRLQRPLRVGRVRFCVPRHP